jgi:alkanesulfonate monooxygenase SsuD/methylene tetrahydromethanopterin reductase-like flavin-dependent oxidoreductase (luciferase family)
MSYFVLKFDMRAPQPGTPVEQLYAAAIEQSAWADSNGFGTLMLAEHHGSEDGYLPAPLMLAAAVAARTQRMRIRVQALILPFHDPIRIAEDLAVLDIISGGRAEVTIAGGYVASEFRMFGVDLAARGRLVEEGILAIKQAWSGERFEFRGRAVRVTPRPLQRPHPPIVLGGASPAAARRAARLACGFNPAMPELNAIYREECRRLGKLPGTEERMGPVFLHVAEDPERAWARIAPHALHETNAYGRWMSESMGERAVYREAADAEALRASGAYAVVTPEECLRIARDLGPGGRLAFHPLMGGMDPDLGWECLHLVRDRVMPHLSVEAPLVPGPPQE